MSATREQPVTHDVGMRISWNNRPPTSIRPEVSDAKLGLPGANVSWETRRDNMYDVCTTCHNTNYVDLFYTQYDGLLKLYTDKFAQPGKDLMAAAKPLLKPVSFSNKIDWVWFELWHREGRHARHGVSMMGPDITHWHGTYEVARNFYAEFIPELKELADHAIHSDDAEKQEQGAALADAIQGVLESDNHKWYLNQMDPEEAAEHAERKKKFTSRYEK